MEDYNKHEIERQRYYKVSKSNEMARRARTELSLQDLKILTYIISKIKPTDTVTKEYLFNINDYCRVCGITDAGNNYVAMKNSLKTLADKSWWLEDANGSQTLFRWLTDVKMCGGNGTFTVRLHEDVSKYLFGLSGEFTEYELITVLPMKSEYSFKLYELLKSYVLNKGHIFEIDELKKQIGAMAKSYSDFKCFRVRALEPAVKEINQYTDLKIEWTPLTWGRKVTHIKFSVEKLDPIKILQNYKNNNLEG